MSKCDFEVGDCVGGCLEHKIHTKKCKMDNLPVSMAHCHIPCDEKCEGSK